MDLRRTQIHFILFFSLICCQQVVAQGQGLRSEQSQATVSVNKSDNASLQLKVTQLQPIFNRDGTISHNLRSHLFRADETSLPELHFQLAVPHNAKNFRVRVDEGVEQRGTIPNYSKVIQRADRGNSVELLGESHLRSLRVVTVVWRSFRKEGGELVWASDADLHVEWDHVGDVEKGGGDVAKEIPIVADELRRAILNYNLIAEIPGYTKTLGGGSDANKLLSSKASEWGIGEESMVLFVPETAIYNVTGAEFFAAGGKKNLAINSLRLRNRGENVEFFIYDNGVQGQFDESDILEFRGERNPGDPGIYLNEITDTNSYILTWSGGEADGPKVVEPSVNQYDQVIESYDSTLHIEKEEFWFGGLTLPQYLDGEVRTLHTSERVPHERFYWRKSRLTIANPLEFECSPVFGPGLQTRMDVRLAGITYWVDDTSSPDQELTFYLNNKLLGTAAIRDTADTVVSFTFASNYLVNGRNNLTVQIKQHDSPIINEVIIDYLELTGRWHALPVNDALVLPSSPLPRTGLSVSGFSSNQIRSSLPGQSNNADSLQRGFTFQLTSRAGTETRSLPGFFAKVGEEQVAADAPGQIGITIVEVEPNNEGGRVLRRGHFNTGGAADQALQKFNEATQFVNEVKNGNIVLAGLAFATAQNNLPGTFINAFESLGSKVVPSENMFAGGWVFAARKGDPSSAVEEFVRDDQGVTKNVFIPDQQNGNVWRAVLPVTGNVGEEGTISTVRKPQLRFHDGDKLLDPANRADLIIITHQAFQSEANRLADYRRSHDGYAVQVVDIQRIYNEFNNGVKSPVAIRQFLQYADTNWAEPKPAFVILFGDASWDSQQRMPGSIMIDYIPSSGVPSTDHIYTVAFGDSTLSPRQFLGRLPVTSLTDAQAIIDKLIEYESQPPAQWNKRFVFATGGSTVRERDILQSDAFRLASNVAGYPLQGEALIISRRGDKDEDLALPSTIDGDTVRQEVNRGALSLDFNGHGATTTLDLNFGFPEDFDNEGRYFILSTWSCQTGLYSDPRATLRNERFVTIPKKGTVASIGGTSFSFTNVDFNIRNNIYASMADPEGDIHIGAIFSLAKYTMYASYGFGSVNVDNGPRARTHMLMYNLLGDPSMPIAIRRTPELAIPRESAQLRSETGEEPQLGDTSLTVQAALWNYGKALTGIPYDSGVVVTAVVINPLGDRVESEVKIDGLTRYDSIYFTLPLNNIPGEYVVTLTADPDETIVESWREDNVLTFTFLLRGSQPLPLEPLPYGVVAGYDEITIRLLNPATGPGAKFELDTVPTFDSPALITDSKLGTVRNHELTTEWSFSIPTSLRSNRKFWWRATSTAGNPDFAARFPLIESFTVDTRGKGDIVDVGGVNQMATTRLIDLVNSPEGIGPGTRSVPVYLYSVGQAFFTLDPGSPELTERTIIMRVGSKDYRLEQPNGLNIVVLPPNDVVPTIDTVFNFFDANVTIAQMEDLVQNHINVGDRVLISASRVSFSYEEENGLEKIRPLMVALGSRVFDTLTVSDPRASYALIGGKGMPSEQVKEVWRAAQPEYDAGKVAPFPVELFDTISAIPRAGEWSSPVFGPATAFRSVSFDLDPTNGNELEVAVIGVRRDGIRDTLERRGVSPGNPSISLSEIDALNYPRLEFSAGFTADTTQRLRSVNLDFDPSPELAIVPSTVRISADSVLQGDPVQVEATIANLTSFQPASNVRFFLNELGELGSIIDSTTIGTINQLDSARYSFSINTTRLRSNRTYGLLANPDDRPGEPYTHNNRLGPMPLKVVTDGIPPGFALFADKARLIDGDYVSPNATLEVRVFDNSELALDSVRSVTMVLDNTWITTEVGGVFETFAKGDYKASFRYKPDEPLSEGAHDILVFLKDASGNGDTSEIVTFFVERDLGLRSVANWPNPFAKETTFTFTVTGENAPEGGEIAIFTPAGRKIKTIRLGPGDISVGYNSVDWDGLDEDRDRIANGVYFYRLKVIAGGETTEIIEKIAILR
ncbi:MAG: C25 family cysteine peptidase [Candidatus Kapaibacterium sp.]